MSAPKHVGTKPMEFPWSVGYAELYQICVNWHGGQWSAMYSVSSTGTIHDLNTLRGLSVELCHCVRDMRNAKFCDLDEKEKLESWEKWCDDQIDMIDAINGEL